MMQQDHVELALSPIEHLYKNLLRSNCKLFNPPIPRYLFGSCCIDLAHGANIRMGGHGEKMLGEHCRIRNHLKSILLKDGIRNMRVLDTLGSLTHKNTVAHVLEITGLKRQCPPDSTRLQSSGRGDLQGSTELREHSFKREALTLWTAAGQGR